MTGLDRPSTDKGIRDRTDEVLALKRKGLGAISRLARAGFEVRQIEREHNHAHVWVLRLRRGRLPVGQEIGWVQKQVCLFLKRHGLRYPKKEVVVMVEGDRIKAAFNWSRGEPGWLIMQRRNFQRQRNTPGPYV